MIEWRFYTNKNPNWFIFSLNQQQQRKAHTHTFYAQLGSFFSEELLIPPPRDAHPIG